MKKQTAKNSNFLKFIAYRIEKSAIKIDPDYQPTKEFEININAGHDIQEKQLFLKMFVKATDKNKKIKIEVDSVAIFERGDALTDDKVEKFMMGNALAILFPHIRAFITNLTALSMIPPVILPTLNFSATKAEKKTSKKKKKESD